MFFRMATGMCTAVVFSAVTQCVQAEPLAFYDFSDGTVGAAADVIAGETAYPGQAAVTDTGGVVPYYTNNAPNRIATDASCSSFLTGAKALAFDYGALTSGNSTPPGGMVNFPALAARLVGRAQAYTIEYFVRLDETFAYEQSDYAYRYMSKTSLAVGDDSRSYKVVTPAASSGGVVTALKLETFGMTSPGIVTHVGAFNSGEWHHIAVVYQPGEDGSTDGTLTFFVDYVAAATLAFDNAAVSDALFRLGTGREAKRVTEPFHGWITCLRVTERALSSTDMMMIVTDVSEKPVVGFWDFTDGEAGTTVQTVTNRLDASLFSGVSGVAWNGSETRGQKPVYSAERPGSIVYGDSRMTNVLAQTTQSLLFLPGTSTDGGGKVEFRGLGTTLATLDSYTVEVFFRSLATGDYRTPLGWRLSETYGFTFKFNDGRPDHDLASASLEILTNRLSNMSTLSVIKLKNQTRLTTNAWHHLAVVCEADKNEATLYCDYEKIGTAVYTNQITAGMPLTLGTSAFNNKAITEAYGGYLSCLRVTPCALAPESFMVTRSADVSPTIFAWSFEEGAEKIGETIQSASGYPDSAFDSADNAKVYCLHRDYYPQYAASLRTGDNVLWNGEAMWPNRTCAYFRGYESVKGLANAHYAGTEMNFPASGRADRNPPDWTMEAFVKARYFYGEATLFGKHGQASAHQANSLHPKLCWALTMNQTGGLNVHWEEAGRTEYTDATVQGVNDVAPGALADMAWHHVALSYSKPTRTFRLYVDYEKVWEKVLTADLLDAPGGYYFSRIESYLGFQGWMDEIRFSNVALGPESFITFPPTGLTLILR